MAQLFKHEHLKKKPSGWRARTITRGKHRLVVGFPGGAKRNGKGKVLTILHPRSENPRLCRINPGAELILLGNPRGRNPIFNPKRKKNSEAGEELFEEFHGTPATKAELVSESQDMPAEAVVLGELVSLDIEGPKGVARIKFTDDGVKLASNVGGNELFFVGGNQNLDAQLANFGASVSAPARLGTAVSIVYEARKAMDGFEITHYEHEFGEENGKRPYVIYDPQIRRISLRGGDYRVEAPGIIN